MATICITGALPLTLKAVENTLTQAGMGTLQAAKRGENSVDISAWHRHVINAGKKHEKSPFVIQPGRLWEQVAGDIFLENLSSPFWGWSEPESVWFLDFWANFDPAIFFILVCSSPQQVVAATLVDVTTSANIDQVLSAWQVQHQEMLRFYNRHAGRSLLVYAEDCLTHPELLISECRSRWNLPLTADIHINLPAFDPPDALLCFLLHGFLTRHPGYEYLHQEIISTAINLISVPVEELQQDPGPDEIFADYLGLRRRLSAAEQERTRLAAQSVELQRQLASLQEVRDEQSRTLSELQIKFEQSNRAQEQLSKLTGELEGKQQDNELLLSQLHQVQEELEAVFLKGQEAKGVIEQLKKERDEQSKLAVERQKSIDKLVKERDVINKSVAESKSWAEQLTKASVESPKLATELKEQQQENELLLLQLHQVQEELENYFLQCQQLKKDNDSLKSSQKRQLRLQQHRSILYDTIGLKREQVNPDYEHLWFRLANLEFQGQSWSTFEFRLSCAHVRPDHFGDFPKLEFPAGEGQTPFNGWFSESSDDFGDKLELRFSLPDRSMDLEIWSRMTAADRDFVTALLTDLQLLLNDAEEEGVRIQRSFSDWQTMVTAMQRIHSDLITAPKVVIETQSGKSGTTSLSYGALMLKREQVNPDYEHLWIEFDNLTFQGESWPHFEFRLSCAHVRPDYFGGFPKLEFPENGGRAPFDSWFIEAEDDFGSKLELRFAVEKSSMDRMVWERLSEHDRVFLQALLAELPRFLSVLQQSAVNISRSWAEWIQMAVEMSRIVNHKPEQTTGTGKKKSSFKKLLKHFSTDK